MGREVRRRGRRRAAAAKEKNKNWFMKLKMWQRVLLCTVGVLICTFSAAAIYVAAKWGKIQTQDIEAKDLIINEEVQEKNGEINLGKGYTNIALFGVDSRDGNLGKGNRTDCIIVASLNNETKEVKMISVYRDTLLDLSDGTLQKCNAAYSYGGPTQAVNMLNMNLDLDIQKYVTVDFGAIADAIDLLGGVEIEIKEEEIQYLNKFVQETADSAGKEAHRVETAGLQLLDGVQAATRFVATKECDASSGYKKAYVNAKETDVKIIKSPVGMPGRALNNAFIQKTERAPESVERCYHCIKNCKPAQIPYCITQALIRAVHGDVENGLVFCGSNVGKIDRISTVREVIEDLMYEKEVKMP